MLIVVLVLVVLALALLVSSLVLGQTLLAWLSIAASVVAAVVLILDVLRRRRIATADAAAWAQDDADDTTTVDGATAATTVTGAAAGTGTTTTTSASTVSTPASASSGADSPTGVTDILPLAEDPDAAPAAGSVAVATDAARLNDVEPGEEETGAADLLVVSDLRDEVVVIDERPRYHVRECDWIGKRETIPLPVGEARDLGFTPCALCTPDRKLAASSRKTKRTKPAGH